MTSGINASLEVAWPVGCPFSGTSQYAQITLNSITGSAFGPAVFLTDQNNYYRAKCGSGAGSCSLESVIAGTPTYLGSPSNPALSSGDTLCLEIDSGTTLKMKTHGSYFGSASVSGLSSGGGGVFVDVFLTAPNTFSNFQTGNGTCP
jgi:hypothetical protein